MECKVHQVYGFFVHDRVVIETLWNVKVVRIGHIYGCAAVVIETLWNVKSISFLVLIDLIVVVIETLWNVKESKVFKEEAL